MTSKKKAVLTIVVSFLLGAVAGVLADHMILRGSIRSSSSSSRYEQFKTRLFQELNLSLPQQSQLEQLMQRRQDAFNELRNTMRAKFSEIREATGDSIRSLLTPTQLEKFEVLLKEYDTTQRQKKK